MKTVCFFVTEDDFLISIISTLDSIWILHNRIYMLKRKMADGLPFLFELAS